VTRLHLCRTVNGLPAAARREPVRCFPCRLLGGCNHSTQYQLHVVISNVKHQ
jgi:hypothetical protein